MTVTTDFEDIRQEISRLSQTELWSEAEELSRRLDALVEAVEILARDHYEYPTLPHSNLRSALSRARRLGALSPRRS